MFVLAQRAAGEPAAAAPAERFDAVIVDMDGVLVDSSGATTRSWQAWGLRRGVDGVSIQARGEGRPARAVLAEHVDADELDADARFLLKRRDERRRGRGRTAGRRGRSRAGLDHAGGGSDVGPGGAARAPVSPRPVCRVPDVLVTSDDVEHGKPAPDPYLLAALRLGVDPARSLVFEDAPAGIAAARAAGMPVWAVTTTHDGSALTEADRVAPGLADHLALLGVTLPQDRAEAALAARASRSPAIRRRFRLDGVSS